jgi:hypothetical protein
MIAPATLAWTVLGVIGAGLAGTIAYEAAPAPHRAASLTAAPSVQPAPPAQPEAARGDDAATATILARPLFASDRRPDPEQSSQRGAPGLPRLSGIVYAPNSAFGIFQADAKTKPVIVPAGGFIAGCGVGTIERDRLTLTCGAVTHVLQPSYLQGAVLAAPIPITRLLHAKRTDPALQP